MRLLTPEKLKTFRKSQVKRPSVPDEGGLARDGRDYAWLFADLSLQTEVADGRGDQPVDPQVAEGLLR